MDEFDLTEVDRHAASVYQQALEDILNSENLEDAKDIADFALSDLVLF